MKRTKVTYKDKNGKTTFKKPPLQRQAMSVSAHELRKLADDLERQMLDQYKQLNLPENKKAASRQKFSVAIINRSKCSDTWKFE